MVWESSRCSNSAEVTAIGHTIFQFDKGSVEMLNTGGLEDFGKILDIVIRKGIVLVITNSHDSVGDGG